MSKHKTSTKKLKALTDWDWTTLVAAWRYYEYRHTIASAMFPGEIVERFFRGEYDSESCNRIARQFAYTDHGQRGFDDWRSDSASFAIYAEPWWRFYAFCKAWCDGFTTVECGNGVDGIIEIEAFYCTPLKRWYPKTEYINNPHNECYIPTKAIKGKLAK